VTTITVSISQIVGRIASLRRIDLSPDWAENALLISADYEFALFDLCEAVGWPEPTVLLHVPGAHEFPLMAFHPVHGWAIAERLEDGGEVRVLLGVGSALWSVSDGCCLYDIVIPAPVRQLAYTKAIDVFRDAVFKRKSTLVLAALATIVVNLIALVTSIYSMQVYDRVVPLGAFSTLLVLSLGTLVALGFDYMIRIIRSNMLEQEAAKIDSEISEYFFARAADVRLDARPPSIGTMAAQLRGLEQVRALMSSAVLFVFADLPFAIFFIYVVYLLGGVVAAVMLVSFPVAICAALIFARLIREDTYKSQVTSNQKNGLLVEALDAAETIKSNRGQWSMQARWNALVEQVHATELPVRYRQATASTLFGTIQHISYIFVIALGAYEVYEQNMTMGALIACSILSSRINGPMISQLPSLLVQSSYARTSLQMLDSIMNLPTDRPGGMVQLRPSRLKPRLALKDVAFVYPAARAGISVPSLEIKAGERVAIIGGIGSGKSTLLRMLAGLYAPMQGSVMIDNLDLWQVSEDVLRTHIGYLPQDYRLVNGTLRDNLLLGLTEPGDDAMMAVADEIGLAAMIATHPMGVDLPIAEGGRGLSGGQRVLTGLTRIMLAKPKLWLLDEPTSSLDVDTELKVVKALNNRVQPDDTLVIVTHKLSLLNLVQRVIVMANGQIVMSGPTSEVVARLQGKSKPNNNQEPSPGPVTNGDINSTAKPAGADA
jgi:ATP-binding cassette subfamily C protein LapB